MGLERYNFLIRRQKNPKKSGTKDAKKAVAPKLSTSKRSTRSGLGPLLTNEMSDKPLYERLGGYDAIRAVVNELLPRLQADPFLGRYWHHGRADGIAREQQVLPDF